MISKNVDELRPGMIVYDDIGSLKSGAILVSGGTVLNKDIIKKIYNQGIRKILIYDEILEIKEEAVRDDFVVKYEKLSDTVESLFKDIKIGKKIILTEISEELDNVILEIVQNDNILRRIRQLERKDDYIFNHSLNVSMLATMIGKWSGYTQKNLKQLALAGLFHDIGKLKISNDIVNKPGRLTENQKKVMRKHPIYSYNILSETVGISKNVSIAALQHHEREDGSGYPQGIRGEKIHEYAKIIAICDVYDALTSNREYKSKISPFHAAEILEEQSFSILDPKFTRLFLNRISEFYVGCVVTLSNGKTGEIIYVHPQNPTKTIVKSGDKYINFLEPQDIKIMDIIE